MHTALLLTENWKRVKENTKYYEAKVFIPNITEVFIVLSKSEVLIMFSEITAR